MTTNLPDEAATLALGAALAPRVAALARPSATPETPSTAAAALVIWLTGDLGAGKTTLVRGLLRALGDTGPVKSPTYTLVEVHPVSGLNLYHFDFYRLNQPEEYLDAGLDEYFSAAGVCLVEWPELAAPYLPAADLHIELALDGAGRRATLTAGSDRGRQCLTIDPTSFALPGAPSSATPPPA